MIILLFYDGLCHCWFMMALNGHDALIKLNVGGVQFVTSRNTLMWISDTFFTSMLSGRIPAVKDENGAIFIDRDPKLFQVILNYMRSKQVDLKEVNPVALKHEAQFYGLTPLVKRLVLCDKLDQSPCGDVLFHGYFAQPLQVFNLAAESVQPLVHRQGCHTRNKSEPICIGSLGCKVPGAVRLCSNVVAADENNSATCCASVSSSRNTLCPTSSLESLSSGNLSKPFLSNNIAALQALVDPFRVRIIRAHHSWIAVAYSETVVCYKSKGSMGWCLGCISPRTERPIRHLAISCKNPTGQGCICVAVSLDDNTILLWSVNDAGVSTLIERFSVTAHIDALLFIASQLVALSKKGKIVVWHGMTQNWQIQDVTPICSYDTAGSFLLLGCSNGSIYYIDMQKFPLRMKDNDLLVMELHRDPLGDAITAVNIYLTPKSSMSGNWLEIAYGTNTGAVRIIAQHPETAGHSPQLFQTFTVHRARISRVALTAGHLISVCSEYNHVRSWSLTRFRGMINTQPGSTPLASFKVMTLESADGPMDTDPAADVGPFGDKDSEQVFVQKVVPDTSQLYIRLASTGERVCVIKSVDGSSISSYLVHECEWSSGTGACSRRFLFTGHNNGSVQVWDLTTALEMLNARRDKPGYERLEGPTPNELLQLIDEFEITYQIPDYPNSMNRNKRKLKCLFKVAPTIDNFPPKKMNAIFFEKQEGMLCAQHALNALLQGQYFTAVDLAEIARRLDAEERKVTGDSTSDSQNMDDSGYFSLQVIAEALKPFNLTLRVAPTNASDVINFYRSHTAFICHRHQHFFTVRKIGEHWYNLNSMLDGPELISQTYSELYLAQLQKEGCTILAVEGDLPVNRGDFLVSSPVSYSAHSSAGYSSSKPEWLEQKSRPMMSSGSLEISPRTAFSIPSSRSTAYQEDNAALQTALLESIRDLNDQLPSISDDFVAQQSSTSPAVEQNSAKPGTVAQVEDLRLRRAQFLDRMWFEARRQEKKIRSIMVDHKKRADRRRSFYDKIKKDPSEFLQIHGEACKIYADAAAASAATATWRRWQGNPSVMIDRFDVRAHLDTLPSKENATGEKKGSTTKQKMDSYLNYERFRILVINDFLKEEQFLKQMYMEEHYGSSVITSLVKREEAKKKQLAPERAAIGYSYEDSTDLCTDTTKTKPWNESINKHPSVSQISSDEDDLDELKGEEFDVHLDVSQLTKEDFLELDRLGARYHIKPGDFAKFLRQDEIERQEVHSSDILREEQDPLRQIIQTGKETFERTTTQNTMLRKEEPSLRLAGSDYSNSSSSSHSSSNEEVTFITSFGGESPQKAKAKVNYDVAGPHKQRFHCARSKSSKKNFNSTSSGDSSSNYRRRRGKRRRRYASGSGAESKSHSKRHHRHKMSSSRYTKRSRRRRHKSHSYSASSDSSSSNSSRTRSSGGSNCDTRRRCSSNSSDVASHNSVSAKSGVSRNSRSSSVQTTGSRISSSNVQLYSEERAHGSQQSDTSILSVHSSMSDSEKERREVENTKRRLRRTKREFMNAKNVANVVTNDGHSKKNTKPTGAELLKMRTQRALRKMLARNQEEEKMKREERRRERMEREEHIREMSLLRRKQDRQHYGDERDRSRSKRHSRSHRRRVRHRHSTSSSRGS
ncbi:BTB/POZ domain-containing protein KCTD3 [Trichinella pseudospiralis]|uniref:Ataxin-3 homolog n=1 Tax=Trichinella pseudospiralis TaxID=6337 RepID=A0A0V1JKF2_TRIPS|nr:BTB/POZ domain-containing protein KCTD3 [Trichinella pseudospiralis]